MIRNLLLTLLAIAFPVISVDLQGCTSAIVSGNLTKSGRHIMWKNRDTSAFDNKVEYIPPSASGEKGYVALFNASDTKCEQAWIGINASGFAVMNTASYNLKDDKVPDSKMDREGYVMSHALRHCVTVDDFELLLDGWPRPMGVEANFGVMDENGDAAYFECNNHTYKRYDLNREPSGVLVRTNYSHSGRKGEGYGQIREKNALALIAPYLGKQELEPYTFTDMLSCSYYHSLYGSDMLTSEDKWLIDQDFIPRYTTVASVVIEDGIMWVALGYPPVAEVFPVWCAPEGVPEQLRGIQTGGKSQACNEALSRKREIFSAPDGNKNRYMNVRLLKGENGYLARFRKSNRLIYDRFHRH